MFISEIKPLTFPHIHVFIEVSHTEGNLGSVHIIATDIHVDPTHVFIFRDKTPYVSAHPCIHWSLTYWREPWVCPYHSYRYTCRPFLHVYIRDKTPYVSAHPCTHWSLTYWREPWVCPYHSYRYRPFLHVYIRDKTPYVSAHPCIHWSLTYWRELWVCLYHSYRYRPHPCVYIIATDIDPTHVFISEIKPLTFPHVHVLIEVLHAEGNFWSVHAVPQLTFPQDVLVVSHHPTERRAVPYCLLVKRKSFQAMSLNSHHSKLCH